MRGRSLNGSMVSNASDSTARLADAASKEFFWGCELTQDKPEIHWDFEEEEDDQDFLIHTLFLRHAILASSVPSDERHIVEVETKNFAGDTVKQPLFSLTSGRTDMCHLDVNFGHEIPVTFRLTEGTGPVYINAQQLVEFPQEFDEDEEYTATETELSEEEEEDAATLKKRKRGAPSGGKKKRGKMDSDANGTEEDESMEEDDTADDEDEDEDEDEEEEDSEEEESEEESPKKKTKGKKGKAAVSPKGKKITKTIKGAAAKKGGKKAKAK